MKADDLVSLTDPAPALTLDPGRKPLVQVRTRGGDPSIGRVDRKDVRKSERVLLAERRAMRSDWLLLVSA